MTRRTRRRRWHLGRARTVAVVAATGLGGVGTVFGWTAVGPVPVASAAPVADCTTTTGVVVAVDLRTFGGQIQVGCDPTTTTALQAMEVAGFTPTGTEQYGLAFICRIDGFPQGQSCASTPPASASWSFWVADPGATGWTYSPGGVATLVPAPGSVEAWTFGSANPDDRPGFAPSQVRATTPGPVPSTTTTTTTAPGAASGVATGSTGSGGTGGTGGSGGPSAAASGTPVHGQTAAVPVTRVGGAPGAAVGASVTTTTRPGTAPTTHGDPESASGPASDTATPHGSTAPEVVAASPAAVDPRPATGSPVPAVLAGLAVLVLAGAAGVVAWRRRRSA